MIEDDEIKKLILDEDTFRKLLEAHLKTPEKVDMFYDAAYKAYVEDGSFPINFGGLLGGFFYMVYRKLYFLCFSGLITSVILYYLIDNALYYITVVFAVSCGYYGYKFYFEKFFVDLEKAEYKSRPLDEVIEKMASSGGVDKWAYPLYFLFWIVLSSKIMERIVFS